MVAILLPVNGAIESGSMYGALYCQKYQRRNIPKGGSRLCGGGDSGNKWIFESSRFQATLQGAAQALEALNSGEAGFGFDGMTLTSILRRMRRQLLRISFLNIWTV